MSRKKSDALSQHTAVSALSGYLYQLQQAALHLFALTEGESLGIEVVDDLHVERSGQAIEHRQVKYHQGASRPRRLSNRSLDLWKTLGIWAAAIADGSLDLSRVQRLVLLTRASLAAKSIASMIASGEDPEKISATILDLQPPKNVHAREGLEAVRALSAGQRATLIGRLEIYSTQPTLQGVTSELKRRLRNHGFHERTLDLAIERTYGWLWELVTTRLDVGRGRAGVLIAEAEFHTAQCRIRDELTDTELPARYLAAQVPESEIKCLEQKLFMRQLALIDASQRVRQRSVLAYFRASAERTEWGERGEILPDELLRYDQDLTERWETEFDCMCSGVPLNAAEQELRRRGLEHFYVIERLDVPIRSGWLYRYLTSGSYHILADRRRVGWHRDFAARLTAQDQQPTEEDDHP
ncbi:MAG TPA: ABC-three component system protein [Ktedonobacterales bacterium]